MSLDRATGSAEVDRAVFLDDVRELLPRLAHRSATAEQQRRISPETVADLDAAGVFRGVQPRRWGGLELDPATYFEGVALVASACGAAGWVGGVVGVHPWELACMAPEAQHDVWAENEAARVSSSYAPTGRAEVVADGYLLEGVWRFSSGVDHCGWSLLGAVVEGEEDLGRRVFLVPRADAHIDHDSWQVSGLAGSGSKDVTVAGAVVPRHRTHLFSELGSDRWARPGWAVNRSPLYRLPWMNVFAWGIAAPALGVARGMVENYRAQSRNRVGALSGSAVAASPGVQRRLAEATAEVDALSSAMATHWQALSASIGDDGAADPTTAVRGRYAGAHTIARSLDVALTVFSEAGGGAMALSNPLQRQLRDLLAMRNHPMAVLDQFAAEQAKLELSSSLSAQVPPS